MGGVLLSQVDIAHRIIHLVEIVFVVVVDRHTLQTTDHPFGVASGDDLCLGDTGIELQFVGWVTAYHFSEGPLCFGSVAQLTLYLSQQEPLTGLLSAALLVLDYLFQIRDSLLKLSCAQIIVGIGVVPVLNRAEIHRVTVHVANHVLSIIEPVEFRIAFGEPGTGQSVLHGLRLVESAHIGEGGGSLVESTFLELGLTE